VFNSVQAGFRFVCQPVETFTLRSNDENQTPRDGGAGGRHVGGHLGGPPLGAQASQAPQLPAAEKATPSADMPAKCQTMMADQEKMMAEIKAADLRLDDLVGKMNAASGMEKAAATAAVVNEMVTQRRSMRAGMMKMQHEMMAHMMAHMQAARTPWRCAP